MIRYPSKDSTPTSQLPFSPVTRVGNLLFVSGQASVDGSGVIVPDSFEGEVRRSIGNLRRVLEDAGSGLHLVAQTRNYVRDPHNLALFNTIYQELFAAPYPARTTLTNCLPETLQFEIECVAVVAEE